MSWDGVERPFLSARNQIDSRRVKPSDASESTKIPWPRFWCPLGAVIHCGDDGAGFLTDPEDDFDRHANPQVARLSVLLPQSGPLVLFGEPGIGKSTELAAMRASLEAETGEPVIWIVFRDIADAADFRRQTVDFTAWQEWRASDGRLTLVVDGVDEGLFRHGELPAAHRELFERGTENLAVEISPARLELLHSLRKNRTPLF